MPHTYLKINILKYITMNKYQDGKIYSLESDGLVYVGSTIRTLHSRYIEHRNRCERGVSDCYSTKIFETGLDVYCKLLEHFPCNNKRELEERESYWIDKLECVNRHKPFMTKEEQRIKKLEYTKTPKMKEYKRQWTLANKEEKQLYDIAYRELNKDIQKKQNQCECGGLYVTRHKSSHFKTKKHLTYYAKD